MVRCMGEIVRINNMYKSFFGVIAMDGMNFSVNEGEIHCLIGENGCGKSSMIKVISGFYPYDQGELFINGKKYRKISPAESMQEGIEVIYQDFSLFPNMTIAENIMMYDAMSAKSLRVNWKQQMLKAKEVLARIRFDIDPNQYVYQLNVAEMQMVAICRALVQKAKLIIMDEPTTALTTSEVKKLFKVVRDLKEQGVSVLFVGHKLDEILEISDTITVMRNGRNVFVSEAGMPLPSKEELIYHMTGKSFAPNARKYVANKQETPLLEVRNLNQTNALHDINFQLYKKEILGITGLLGCGRQELAEVLFGIDKAQSGTILIDGQDVGLFHSVQDALKHQIAYVPEDRLTKGLHMNQSIENNAVARVIGSFRSRLGLLNKKKLEAGKKEALHTVFIRGMRPYNPVKSLSGGNQQKVGLVKWLAMKPRILILNCPTVGVDVGAKEDIHQIVRGLAEQGLGVIVISDDIPEVLQLCSRVLVMKNGSISSEVMTQDISLEKLEAMLADEENQQEESA